MILHNCRKSLLSSLATGLVLCSAVQGASAAEYKSPDILVLGDSQLSFGSGPVFLEFFENIKAHCAPNEPQLEDLKQLGEMSVGVIGVRSTSLHSWVARKGRSKGSICDVDPKWKVNAGTFGIVNKTKNKYVQIGQGADYQFCQRNKSPFEAMFREGYYQPKLLIMSFLGNSAGRWARNKKNALRDVERTMQQIPANVPCIFMTTAPSYQKKVVDLRLKAQENVKYAFMKNGSRCSFVEGFTPETIAANQGNRMFFRLNKSGKVKDPFHPNSKGARKFFSVGMNNICQAIFNQIDKPEKKASLQADTPEWNLRP